MIDRDLFDERCSVAFEIPPFEYLARMFPSGLIALVEFSRTRMRPEINDEVPVRAT